jgi:uncharacterized protein YceH (UPF0502 family)
MSNLDSLTNLSKSDLETLANIMVPPEFQNKLSDLLAKNHEGKICESELADLDEMLAEVDHLTLLKARAKYTLQQLL